MLGTENKWGKMPITLYNKEYSSGPLQGVLKIQNMVRTSPFAHSSPLCCCCCCCSR